MPSIDTVVVGASAGGVEALSRLVARLPAELPAALLVVLHFPESSTSLLPTILERSGAMPAKHAEDGEPIENGRIYVAPPGRHLLVENDRLSVTHGPKENGHRPAIDALFRTAAHARRNRVVGVLLSGLLDDGTMGMWAVRRQGGLALCQDPEEAAFGDMPRNAIGYGAYDEIRKIEAIAARLVELAGQPLPSLPDTAGTDPTHMSLDGLQRLEAQGEPSAFVCPECQGTLFELAEEGILHFRCRVGHSYLPDSLSANQEGVLEAALWTALRAIKEHNDLLQDLLDRAEKRGFGVTAKGYRAKLEEGAYRMSMLQTVLGLPAETATARVD